MGIIKSHDITLYGGNDAYQIILRPLSDEHLPYLYVVMVTSSILNKEIK